VTGRIILDGGMGRELWRRGVEIPPTLWSANALLVAPHIVQQVHEDYIAAGADIITLNNYSLVPAALAAAGLEHRLEELLADALRLARAARERAGRLDVRIAGALPPLANSYRADLVPPLAVALPAYRRIAAALADGVDLLLCETMSSVAEARVAATVANETGLPVWVAWSLHDDASGRLRSGESVAEAVAALGDLPVDAFLFNCSTPESIAVALPLLRRLTDRPIGAYANAFRPVPGDWDMARDGLLTLRDDISPASYAAMVQAWEASGATIFGGCCGIGPDHIACLAAGSRLNTASPR
jgi:S-methylmethionine-dependent homocysteine/selenocysteine methylase